MEAIMSDIVKIILANNKKNKEKNKNAKETNEIIILGNKYKIVSK
jgi:hypothetical protein